MGDRCNYAHGSHQLRGLPDSLRPYWRAGHCKKDNCQYWHGDLPQSNGSNSTSSSSGGVQQLVLPYGPQATSAQYARQQEEITALLQGTFLQQQQQQQQQASPPPPPPPRQQQPSGSGSSGQERQASAAAPSPAALPGPSAPLLGADAGALPQRVQPTGKASKAGEQQGEASGSAGASGSGGRPPLVISEMMRDLMHRRFNSLLCPITLEPFEDPVVAADGRIYERRAIEDWLYREGNNSVAEVVEFVESMRRQFL